jgi:hypothetical protein
MPQLLLFALLIFMPVANAATAINIDYLANHPEWAPQLAQWTYTA